MLAAGISAGPQFRVGSGWWQPEDWGCATRPEGGELAFAVDNGAPQVRCWLRLGGPLLRQSEATIQCGPSEFRCDLPAGTPRWVSFVADVIDGKVAFVLRGHTSINLANETAWQDRRRISVGVSGLLCTANEQGRSLIAIARVLAESGQAAIRFVRDAHLLLVNRPVDAKDLQVYVPLLDAGVITRMEMVDMLTRDPAQAKTADMAIVFD